MKKLNRGFLSYEDILGDVALQIYKVISFKPGSIQPFYHISYRLIFEE